MWQIIFYHSSTFTISPKVQFLFEFFHLPQRIINSRIFAKFEMRNFLAVKDLIQWFDACWNEHKVILSQIKDDALFYFDKITWEHDAGKYSIRKKRFSDEMKETYSKFLIL
jgi:hypothetical protein